MSENHLSDLTFSSLDLVPDLMRGIEEAGFTRCTPIQAQTLPFALAGRDVAGQAQTGTGKTAAFLVGLFQNLLKQPASPTRGATAIRALIIAPTRELAIQIHQDAIQLGQHTGLRIAVVYGGVDYEKQRRDLEGEQARRVPQAAAGAEDLGGLDAHGHARLTLGPRHDMVGEPVGVDDDLLVPVPPQVREHVVQHRDAAHGEERLRGGEREGPEAGAEAGGEHEGSGGHLLRT